MLRPLNLTEDTKLAKDFQTLSTDMTQSVTAATKFGGTWGQD